MKQTVYSGLMLLLIISLLPLMGCGDGKYDGKWKVTISQNQVLDKTPIIKEFTFESSSVYLDGKKKGFFSIGEENEVTFKLRNMFAMVPEITLKGKIQSDKKMSGKSVVLFHVVSKEVNGIRWYAEKVGNLNKK